MPTIEELVVVVSDLKDVIADLIKEKSIRRKMGRFQHRLDDMERAMKRPAPARTVDEKEKMMNQIITLAQNP
ncbi:hypothetical protein IMZ48_49475 [Candidatus Bathyarchaeota archaeon]|nr:hypothetical protein [Candidatus Bathyarchaeota archaeon]